MKKSHSPIALTICIAIFVISIFYILVTLATDGHPALLEPDQSIYLQYAKNIAQGQPYVFSPGDAPSTGSTTHLYPYILALFYKLGATGDAFLNASFLFNAFCYCGVGLLLWSIAKKMAPALALPAALLTLISGHTVSATLHQTDMGFYSLLALAVFSSLLNRRFWSTLILTVICALSRPEGAIFSVAFFSTGVCSFLKNRVQPNPETCSKTLHYFAYALAGLMAFATTLWINYQLTGHVQFMSVMNKGYSTLYTTSGALLHTLSDLVSMLKGIILGLPDVEHNYRQFYFLPLIGGALSLTGLLLYTRKSETVRYAELWLLFCVGAIFTTIAGSEYQGTSYDRYLAWLLPLWFLYALIGIQELAQRISAPYFRPILLTLLFGYQLVTLVFFLSTSYSSAIELELRRQFAKTVQKEIPTNHRMGSMIGSCFSFHLPEHKEYNLSGITSPDFFAARHDRQPLRIIEKLKHNPELRYEYWLVHKGFQAQNPWAEPFIGNLKLADSDAALTGINIRELYHTDWNALDGGELPTLIIPPADSRLIDQLDVGYQLHEKEHSYKTITRLKNLKLPLCSLAEELNGAKYAEVGRIIIGEESFSLLNLTPNQPATVVMRTARKATGKSICGTRVSTLENFELNHTLHLRLFVDDQELPDPVFKLRDEGFSEVSFEIPARYITTPSPRLRLIGDHISLAYWFYQ